MKIDGHISYIERDYNEIALQQTSVEKALNRKPMKTTIQLLYDEGFFDSFSNADDVSKDFLVVRRHRPNLGKVNDVIQSACLKN